MRGFVSSLAAVCFVSAQAQTTSTANIAKCMSCHRLDTLAGFLLSYSWCGEDEYICLQDAWNYIDYDCSSRDGWKRAKKISLLDYCNPLQASTNTCRDFTATSGDSENWISYQTTLMQGYYCDIEVDASEFLARLKLSETSFLGIEYVDGAAGKKKILLDEETQFKKGSGKHTIRLYNGAENGPLTFSL